jgi:pimeloyl-ACP methyl ester carboxylesterase
LTAIFLAALTLALLIIPTFLGFIFMSGLLYAPCHATNLTPAAFDYAWEDVTIQTGTGGEFQGYFIPGPGGATILIPPSYTMGRDGRLRQADMLRRHGYSVFTFESRPCAGLGPHSLGQAEVAEVADALDYLLGRQDVDPDRVGIYGFSSAGATAVMAAARLPALRAVVAEGGYGDFPEETLGPGPERGLTALFRRLFNGSARLAYRLLTGLDIDNLSPKDVIDQIEPRPILLIYGSREVSLIGARSQLAAAGEHTILWVVEGAGHGNYLDIAPAAYEARIVEFFDKALQ